MASPFAAEREADKLRKRYESLERRALAANAAPDSDEWRLAFEAEAELYTYLDIFGLAGGPQDPRTVDE